MKKIKNILLLLTMLVLSACATTQEPRTYDINNITPGNGRIHFVFSTYDLSKESTTSEKVSDALGVLLVGAPRAIQHHDFHLARLNGGKLEPLAKFNTNIDGSAYIDMPEGDYEFVLARTNRGFFNMLGGHVTSTSLNIKDSESYFVLVGHQGASPYGTYLPGLRKVKLNSEQEQFCRELATKTLSREGRVTLIREKNESRFFLGSCRGLIVLDHMSSVSEKYARFYKKKEDKIVEMYGSEKNFKDNLEPVIFNEE